MIKKRRIGKIGTLFFATAMILASLQGCKEVEDAGKLPETTVTPVAVTEPATPTEEPENLTRPVSKLLYEETGMTMGENVR